MASSTTSPIESTIPSRVNTLIEKPMMYIKKNVPTKDTGIAVRGMMVLRQSRKKIKIIKATRIKAVMMVSSTSKIERRTERV